MGGRGASSGKGSGSSAGAMSAAERANQTVQRIKPTHGLPQLVGSEKQVNWANDIRDEYIRKFNALDYAIKQVNAGRGDERPGSGSPSWVDARYGATFKGIMNTLARDTGKLIRGEKHNSVSSALDSIEKKIHSENKAQFWINNR